MGKELVRTPVNLNKTHSPAASETVCRYARKKQKGVVYTFVKSVEGYVCPACRAYERVYGKKAHEN